jgi:hypothetical protein
MQLKAFHVPLMVFCAVFASAATEDGYEQLQELGREFHSIRNTPLDLKSGATWPNRADVAVVIGLQRRDVLSTLGEPDNCSPPFVQSCERLREFAYSFVNTRELPWGLRGGGFPELTFEFDERDIVVAVSCHYAR